MKIFDENMNLIENPDLEKGKLEQSFRKIVYHYEITQEEKGHYRTVKEYPNGGKDVEWVIDTPEEGNWIAYDQNGNKIETDVIIPADSPHETNINYLEEISIYTPYTDEELAQKSHEKEEDESITTDEVLDVLLGIGGVV